MSQTQFISNTSSPMPTAAKIFLQLLRKLQIGHLQLTTPTGEQFSLVMHINRLARVYTF